jgi:hypothetical protein
VLDTLQGERLLSDHRYATQRVTARAGRYGDARLKQELRLKGVSDDDIAAALPEAATKPSAALRSGSASSASRTNAGRACQTDAFPAISRFFQRSHPPCLARYRAMNTPAAKLSANNLKKRYKARTVVEDVSFEVKSARSSACSARTAPARPPAST